MQGWQQFVPLSGIDPLALATFPLFVAFLLLCIAVHEAAHAAMALALNVAPERVIIGVGPGRWTWHRTIRGVRVSVGPYPIGGAAVFPEFERRVGPWARIPVLLAGPVSNMAFGTAILVATTGFRVLPSIGQFLLHSPQTVWPGLWHAISNPIPPGTDPANTLTPVGFLNLGGLFAFALGLINLMPFPPLDGGNVVLALVDALGLGIRPVRIALMAIGAAGVLFLMLPTFAMMAARWQQLAGGMAIAGALGFAIRGFKWYSHYRWGTPPPPRLFWFEPTDSDGPRPARDDGAAHATAAP